jgi:hypothetical protein
MMGVSFSVMRELWRGESMSILTASDMEGLKGNFRIKAFQGAARKGDCSTDTTNRERWAGLNFED